MVAQYAPVADGDAIHGVKLRPTANVNVISNVNASCQFLVFMPGKRGQNCVMVDARPVPYRDPIRAPDPSWQHDDRFAAEPYAAWVIEQSFDSGLEGS
jgi:hypothetical protein